MTYEEFREREDEIREIANELSQSGIQELAKLLAEEAAKRNDIPVPPW